MLCKEGGILMYCQNCGKQINETPCPYCGFSNKQKIKLPTFEKKQSSPQEQPQTPQPTVVLQNTNVIGGYPTVGSKNEIHSPFALHLPRFSWYSPLLCRQNRIGCFVPLHSRSFRHRMGRRHFYHCRWRFPRCKRYVFAMTLPLLRERLFIPRRGMSFSS